MDDAEETRQAKYGQLPSAVRPEDIVTTHETGSKVEPNRGLAVSGPGS